MYKFKVGDKVCVKDTKVKDGWTNYHGIVTDISEPGRSIECCVDDKVWFFSGRLELTTP